MRTNNCGHWSFFQPEITSRIPKILSFFSSFHRISMDFPKLSLANYVIPSLLFAGILLFCITASSVFNPFTLLFDPRHCSTTKLHNQVSIAQSHSLSLFFNSYSNPSGLIVILAPPILLILILLLCYLWNCLSFSFLCNLESIVWIGSGFTLPEHFLSFHSVFVIFVRFRNDFCELVLD